MRAARPLAALALVLNITILAATSLPIYTIEDTVPWTVDVPAGSQQVWAVTYDAEGREAFGTAIRFELQGSTTGSIDDVQFGIEQVGEFVPLAVNVSGNEADYTVVGEHFVGGFRTTNGPQVLRLLITTEEVTLAAKGELSVVMDYEDTEESPEASVTIVDLILEDDTRVDR